jgi:hypothetical protein
VGYSIVFRVNDHGVEFADFFVVGAHDVGSVPKVVQRMGFSHRLPPQLKMGRTGQN